MARKVLIVLVLLLFVAGGGAGLFLYWVRTVRSEFQGERVFHIEMREDIFSVAGRLERDHLVASKWYFLWSAWRGGLQGKLHAGDVVIPGGLAAPEVVVTLLAEDGKPKTVTITFPEGWTAEKMAARLSANRFDGEKFLALVRKPLPEWKGRYSTLSDMPETSSLEGFLFPDTYTFLLDATPQDIVEKMLRNFETRFGSDLREETRRQGKTIFGVVTLASIVEREIGTVNQPKEMIERDRRMVSDLFWRRLADNHPLESDATVAYARGESKIQHSLDDLRINSPYNTYANKGLPPGPISNPGLVSLRSVVFPEPNEFYFFLNNPQTGQTFFAKTFDEHKRNKSENGL